MTEDPKRRFLKLEDVAEELNTSQNQVSRRTRSPRVHSSGTGLRSSSQ